MFITFDHLTYHNNCHFMSFDILWHLTFHDIWHLNNLVHKIEIQKSNIPKAKVWTTNCNYAQHTKNSNKPKVSRTGSNFAQHPINRINIQQTFSAYHKYGWHNLGMDNKPQIRSINRRNLTELKSWDDEMNYNWNMLGTLGTITVVTMFDNKPGPIDPSLCQ